MAVRGKRSLMHSLPAPWGQFKYATPQSMVEVRDQENVDGQEAF